ncbi:hypothetical protein, partial [Streptomyces sp. NPDC059378]|uniref:hypothetical protein n=1 Tax=Streptomyces sp. NPDC059378 TaxID=3346815 RepID=UPI0036AF2FBB
RRGAVTVPPAPSGRHTTICAQAALRWHGRPFIAGIWELKARARTHSHPNCVAGLCDLLEY